MMDLNHQNDIKHEAFPTLIGSEYMPTHRHHRKKHHSKPPVIITWAIWLLTQAIKARLAGGMILLAAFLLNCYFILFDQQNYITLLEHFSSDGHISDINSVFFKVQIPILFAFIIWHLIDQPFIDLIRKHAQDRCTALTRKQHTRPYIVACLIWLLISYLPYLFLDEITIINSIKEDGFFQNCGASFLFIASMLFFYLFFRRGRGHPASTSSKKRNIWFLLLSLLFFFGAGEEISWGQRIFHFETPAFMASNIQNEFSIHNLPWFDGRSEKPYFDKHGVLIQKISTGFIKKHLTASSLLFYFCTVSFIALPVLCLISSRMRDLAKLLNLPIAPIFSGIFFLIENTISKNIHAHYHSLSLHAKANTAWDSVNINHSLEWGSIELHETFISFLFMIVAIWLINNRQSYFRIQRQPSSNLTPKS